MLLVNLLTEFSRMMTMPTVMNNSLLVHRNPEKPETAFVFGGRFPKVEEMTIAEAEMLEDNEVRIGLGLESMGMEYPSQVHGLSVCTRCKLTCSRYCSACGAIYCSRTCQSRDWWRHSFVCRVRGRPNDVDRLKIMVRWWKNHIQNVGQDFSRPYFLTTTFVRHSDLAAALINKKWLTSCAYTQFSTALPVSVHSALYRPPDSWGPCQ